MRLYIAGPMTGLPEFNIPAFRRAALLLADAGHAPIDPSQLHPQIGLPWADYMRADIPAMLACDGVATLPDWWRSRGARLEVHIASSLEMPVLAVTEWLANTAAVTR